MVLSSYASAEAVLYPAEKELGVMAVDIGSGTTDLALFEQGALWFTAVVPAGGDYITSDLAVGLRTPLNQAEAIKTEEGCTLAALSSDKDTIGVPSVGGKDTWRVSRREIAQIIQPRVQEILGLVKNKLDHSDYKGLLPGGVVLTGGTALTPGIAELASELLQRPVRIGYPAGVGGLADVVHSPVYSSAIGLLLYGSKRQTAAAEEDEGLSLKLLFGRIRQWVKELF
jgi:cell division protein FtsA